MDRERLGLVRVLGCRPGRLPQKVELELQGLDHGVGLEVLLLHPGHSPAVALGFGPGDADLQRGDVFLNAHSGRGAKDDFMCELASALTGGLCASQHKGAPEEVGER